MVLLQIVGFANERTANVRVLKWDCKDRDSTYKITLHGQSRVIQKGTLLEISGHGTNGYDRISLQLFCLEDDKEKACRLMMEAMLKKSSKMLEAAKELMDNCTVLLSSK